MAQIWARLGRLAPSVAPFLGTAAASAVGVLAVRTYVVDVVQCKGPSMLPTINEKGDYVLCTKADMWMYRAFGPAWSTSLETGDVVIASSPTDRNQLIVKRIVAMPGEVMIPRRRQASSSVPRYSRSLTVPEGLVWLQGDNSSNSVDSRSYGPVPLDSIEGRVVARIYPFRLAGRMERRKDLAFRAGNLSIAPPLDQDAAPADPYAK